MQKIAQALQGNNARVENFFDMFDRPKRKRITFAQAVRALDMADCSLPAQEKELLSDYQTPDGFFDYLSFLDDLHTESQETHNDFRKNIEENDDILQMMRRTCDERGIDIRQVFKDFDRAGRGKITLEIFKRELINTFHSLSMANIECLGQAFASSNGQVDVRAFEKAIRYEPKSQRSRRSPIATHRVKPHSVATEIALDEAHQILKHGLHKRRAALFEFFQVFDKLNTGKCSPTQFVRALDASGVILADRYNSVITVLLNEYEDSADGKILYKELCSHVDPSRGTPNARDSNVNEPPTHQLNNLTDDQKLRARDIIDNIRRRVKTERIDLVPALRAYDTTHEELITSGQFLRALTSLKLLPANPRDADALQAYFRAPSPKSHLIMWRKFIKQCEPVKQQPNPTTSTTHHINKCTKQDDADVNKVQQKLSTWVQKSQIRLQPFLQDFDKMREGKISAHSLSSGLASAGLVLKANEIACLARKFADACAVDSQGEPLVRWRALLNSVEMADPLIEQKRESHALAFTEGSDAIDAITRYTKISGLLMLPTFQDFDKHKRGILPRSQFLRACSMLRLPSSACELSKIADAFAIDNGQYVSYRRFVDACESAEATPDIKTKVTRAMVSHPVVNSRENDRTEILDRIRAQLTRNGIVLKDFLGEFDPMNHGTIPLAKFDSALALANISLGKEDLDHLKRAYEHDSDPYRLNWRVLTEDLGENTMQMELTPTATITSQRRTTRASDLSPHAQKLLRAPASLQLLDNVRAHVVSKRIDLKQRFQDFDRLRREVVTRPQFIMILNTERGLRLTPSELNLLADLFSTPQQEINYKQFLRRVQSGI